MRHTRQEPREPVHIHFARNVNINLQRDFVCRASARSRVHINSNANWFHLSECTRQPLPLVGRPETCLPKRTKSISIDWILLMANWWGKSTNRMEHTHTHTHQFLQTRQCECTVVTHRINLALSLSLTWTRNYLLPILLLLLFSSWSK